MIGSLLSTKVASVAFALTAATGSAAVAATGVVPLIGHDDPVTATNQDETGADDGVNNGYAFGVGRDGDADHPNSADSEHGNAVSMLATTTDLTGWEKGAAISSLASGGRSHAGEEHGRSSDHSKQGVKPDHPGAPETAGEQGHNPPTSGDNDDPDDDESGSTGSESENPND